jgi:pentose-5-phosphate-3-epimerase
VSENHPFEWLLFSGDPRPMPRDGNGERPEIESDAVQIAVDPRSGLCPFRRAGGRGAANRRRSSLQRVTRLPLGTHMMISDPDRFLERFVEAGSDSFLVHWEGNANLQRTVQRTKTLGKRAGVMVMTVHPGFGHQRFPATTLAKDPSRPRDDRACQARVRSGGGRGIDTATARLAVEAGANTLVAGSAIFGDSEGVAAGMDSQRTSLDLVEQ